MYLVTGGGGFIGSHIVRAMVERGERVRVLDNGSSGSRGRIADVLGEVEWLDGDIRDPEMAARACQKVEVILHQAAVVSTQRSIKEPQLVHAVNLTGTLNMLVAAHEAGVRRVVIASSAAVYGDLPFSPKAETQPVQPLSPYGVQKLASEAYCPVWSALYGLETVALRYFNVFGPGQDPDGEYAAVIPRFISTALAGDAPEIYGDGNQSRDFIYVGNVVEINLLAATLPAASGQTLNVGMGQSVTINQLVQTLGEILGREIQPTYLPPRSGDIRDSLADVTRLQATLGYRPRINFRDGLERTIRGFAEQAP
ncbi:MAG: SDR family oxidoreductase [Ktedonobacterales bacterium]